MHGQKLFIKLARRGGSLATAVSAGPSGRGQSCPQTRCEAAGNAELRGDAQPIGRGHGMFSFRGKPA